MADDDTIRREATPTRAEDDLGQAIHMLVAGWRVFGRYSLESRIGRGEMSVVWRAHDELLDEAVALKFVAESVAQDAVAVDDLRQKTARARSLAHPNIIRVNDFMRDNTLATVSMEYVESETLEHKWLEQPGHVFSPAALVPLILQICPALDYAHMSARIVHRGLKPSNILITPEGAVKITDFGIACSLAETRLRLTSLGERDRATRFRLSLQQLEGRPPSPADDIYAFGAMLYELLTGQPPFLSGRSAEDAPVDGPVAMAARRAECGVTGEAIPQAWEKIVAACLAQDPMRRPSSGEEILCQLELAGRKPTPAEPSPVPEVVRAKDSVLAPPAAWTALTPPTRSSQSPLIPKKRSLIHYLTREESERKVAAEQILPARESVLAKASVAKPAAEPVPVSAPAIESAVAAETPRVASVPPIPPVVANAPEQMMPVEEPAPVEKSATESAPETVAVEAPESATEPVPVSAPAIEPVAAVEAPRVASVPPIPPAPPVVAVVSEQMMPVEEPAPAEKCATESAPETVAVEAPESAAEPVPVSAPAIEPVAAVEAPRVASVPPIPPVVAVAPEQIMLAEEPVLVNAGAQEPAPVSVPSRALESATVAVPAVAEPTSEQIVRAEVPAAPVQSGPGLTAVVPSQAATSAAPKRTSEKPKRPKRSLAIHYPTPEEAEREAEELAEKSGTGGSKERSWVSRALKELFRR
jgi:serine/threonine-protein kinase